VAEPAESARLLAAQSEYGYTDRMDRALRDEPEAVSPEEQRRQTSMAQAHAQAIAKADWEARRDRLRGELADLQEQAYTRLLGSELRLMERHLAKLDRAIQLTLS